MKFDLSDVDEGGWEYRRQSLEAEVVGKRLQRVVSWQMVDDDGRSEVNILLAGN